MEAAARAIFLVDAFPQNRWLHAGVQLGVALVIAAVVNRLFARRGERLAQVVARGDLTPEADTRLRFLRRLTVVVIVLVGLAAAASNFAGLSNLATSLLASGAIAAAILGFAARQTLANLVAGVMLAITQPIRVGDWVTFDEAYGVVEDVQLNYTYLRTPSGQRIIIPNEKLASGVLRNDTLKSNAIGLDVSLWLAPHVDAQRALEVLREETPGAVSVAEVTPEGVRLAIAGEPVPPPERYGREAELRARCLHRLRAEGLLATEPAPTP